MVLGVDQAHLFGLGDRGRDLLFAQATSLRTIRAAMGTLRDSAGSAS